MKKQVYEINTEGLLQEIHIAQFDDEGVPIEELPSNVITLDIPQGLYRPRWNGTEWLEDMLQTDIDALKNAPKELTELDIVGMQMVEKDMQIFSLESDNKTLGEQIVAMDIRLMAGGL